MNESELNFVLFESNTHLFFVFGNQAWTSGYGDLSNVNFTRLISEIFFKLRRTVSMFSVQALQDLQSGKSSRSLLAIGKHSVTE